MAGPYANPGIVPPNVTGGDPTATGGWASDIGSLLNLAGGAYGLYQAGHLQGAAQDVFRQSDPFAGYRPGYGAQLLKLMQDPSSVSSLPGYQFLLDQGVEAIDRSAAAPGGVGFGSGAEGASLVKYGQGLADQFYQQQVSTLTGLAGANFPPANPYAALQGLGGAAQGIGASTQYLGNALPGTINLLSRLFPGTSAGTPGAVTAGGDLGAYAGTSPLADASAGGLSTGQPDWLNWGGGGPMGFGAGGGGPGMDFSRGIGGPVMDFSGGAGGGGGDNIDLSGLFTGPRAAGGEAATAVGGSNIAQDLSLLRSGLGLTGSALGIIQGLQTGGVSGYSQAALGASRLGVGAARTAGAISPGIASEAGQALGYAAIPLSVYNFAKNWQSGATGSEAIQGAETGAAIGSVIPGVGTLIGAGVGAAVGAVSSAFGPGRMDPENVNWNSYAAAFDRNPGAVRGATPSQNFQALAGIFDSRGSAIPFYGKFGRMGENQFAVSMANQVNSAIKSGAIPANAGPSQIYSMVVEPWITKMGGSGGWQDTYTSKGASEKDAVGGLLTNLIAQWQKGQITAGTPVGISGQTISGLPTFGG
jgi:hypothetical protein